MEPYRDFTRKVAGRLSVPAEEDPIETGLFVREVLAHSGSATNLTVTMKGGVLTCCREMCEVKVWDPVTLDLWGIILPTSEKLDLYWAYPN